MRTSQTSTSLASKELNFWVLSLDQVIVILLSIVNFASKFLKDKEWFKFGVVMTIRHFTFLESFHDILSSQASLNIEESKKNRRF